MQINDNVSLLELHFQPCFIHKPVFYLLLWLNDKPDTMYIRQLKSVFVLTFLGLILSAAAQESDKTTLTAIYQNALSTHHAANNLKELCSKAKGRLMGSKESELAIQLLRAQLLAINPDTCYLLPYTSPSWRCKSPAQARIQYGGRRESLRVVNLGLSVSTPAAGIEAEVLEVHTLSELDSLGSSAVKDKIVFFNRAMDNTRLNTFEAYSAAVDQRANGASKASQYGAVGVIVRSLSTEPNDFPHTGVSKYKAGVVKIPNLSVSTNDADKLSRLNKSNTGLKLWIKSDTEDIDTVHTANLIAEIKGSRHPEQVILIGAHMDSWFNTPGAHDDGAGCAQMIDVIRIFRQLNIRPEHSIRLVLFMDEEMYQSGSKAYAGYAASEKKEHIASIESDAGGSLPLGFGIDAPDSVISAVQKLSQPLSAYGIYKVAKGYGGVDIAPLKQFNVPLIGLMTNSQRYFDYHHSANDTYENVNRREMQMGTAAIAGLVYLIDRYGLK